MQNDPLRTKVFSNLNDALTNDYDARTWTAMDIALDLVCFAADCENNTPDELVPHVEAWMKENTR